MVASDDDKPDCLTYCLQGSKLNLVSWGHEYLRCLSGQIGTQYQSRIEKSESANDILSLVDQIIPEFINHNEEAEAVDLLMEVERLSKLGDFCNKNNFERVCIIFLAVKHMPQTQKSNNRPYTLLLMFTESSTGTLMLSELPKK